MLIRNAGLSYRRSVTSHDIQMNVSPNSIQLWSGQLHNQLDMLMPVTVASASDFNCQQLPHARDPSSCNLWANRSVYNDLLIRTVPYPVRLLPKFDSISSVSTPLPFQYISSAPTCNPFPYPYYFPNAVSDSIYCVLPHMRNLMTAPLMYPESSTT